MLSPALLPALPQLPLDAVPPECSRDQKVSQPLVLVRLGTGGPRGELVHHFQADVAGVNGNQGERDQRHRIVIGCLCERKSVLVQLHDEF